MKTIKLTFASVLVLVAVFACQKSELQSSQDEILLSQQETQSEEIASDVDFMVDEAVQNNVSQLKSASLTGSVYLNDCSKITIDTLSSPKVLIIDFGTGCTGKDGKIRSGKIIVTAASFKTFPTIRTKTFDNYSVDGKSISGSIVKTILQDKVNNVRTATTKENITIILPDNKGTIHRIANLTRIYDFDVLGNRSDNKITSWGNVEFTRASGVTMTKTIEESNPLVFTATCHHIVSGTVTITTSNNRSWSIDYGTGECDNTATLSMGGKTKEITLR
jgi:hypothetical protein